MHTGWGACVIVGGSLRAPEIVSTKRVELLQDPERFCYHRAAEMQRSSADAWLTRLHTTALARACSELGALLTPHVRAGAIVAKQGSLPELDSALATHMKIHAAEGLFYRNLFRDAAPGLDWRIVPPNSLDVSIVGKFPVMPWGRDQRLAALAAWQVLGA